MSELVRAIIIEDEPLIAEHLATLLRKIDIEATIYEVDSELLANIRSHNPDLVLLDINLHSELDGIEIAAHLNVLEIPFMYITSYYDQDTLRRARNTDPIAFILKPFTKETIFTNIEIAKAKIKKRRIGKESMNAQPFFIKIDNQLRSILPMDILYLEAYDNYCFIHTIHERLLCSKSLKMLEATFSAAGIIRIHKSFAINPQHLTTIQDDFVYLQDRKVRLGKRYKQNLLKSITVL